MHPPVVIGLDVGTQSCKCVVIDSAGTLCGVGQQGYEIMRPQPEWGEQRPGDWWQAIIAATRAALRAANVDPAQVLGIGVTGQMHGVVLIGEDHEPVYPAIIWLDRRSAALSVTIQGRVSPAIVREKAANRLSPGFAAASLAWLRAFDPMVPDQTRAILQPKDYAVLRLTGMISSEHSDASATWLYDVPGRTWAPDLIAACGGYAAQLPPLNESAAIVGELRADPAAELGLPVGIPVIAGAADQAALLTGAGVITPGTGAITIGTGGQITVVSDQPRIDPELRLNTFCHALPGRWYTMGAILNGGIALRWWRDTIDPTGVLAFDTLIAEAAAIPAGADGLIYLPYLAGERTPHMDPHATGAFVGLTQSHTRAHLTRAVLEGVAYAFHDCLMTLRATGPVPSQFVIGGGGAQGPLWRCILASVLGVTLQTLDGAEHTATGAALLAGASAGVFADIQAAIECGVHYGPLEEPNPADQPNYEAAYERFRALYPALRSVGNE